MASARRMLKASSQAELHTLAELDTEDQVQLCRWAVKAVERCGVACPGGFAIIPFISLVPPVSFPALISRSLQHTIDAAASWTKVKETLQQWVAEQSLIAHDANIRVEYKIWQFSIKLYLMSQAFRDAAVKLEWDSRNNSASLVCCCPLIKGSQLAEAPLLIAQSSQAVLSSHGYEALRILQDATAGILLL